MPFCPKCGTEVQSSYNFCSVCGRALPEGEPGAIAQRVPDALIRTSDYRISPRRILLMTVLSYGLYLFYWFYLTWKQYRDHTGNEVFPVWHAMAIGIPIYSLFRTHAHMRSFKELMLDAGVASSISAGWAVTLVLISGVLNGVSFNLTGGLAGSSEITRGTAVMSALLDLASMTIVAGLLLHIQGNLNRYWESLENLTLVDARIGAGEVLLGIIGALVWLLTIASLVSPDLLAAPQPGI
jgi:hypothetical protein